MNHIFLLSAVKAYASDKLNLVVRESSDLGQYNTGEFDGVEIVLAKQLDWETKLYVLLHCLGHTYQWNTDADLRGVGLDRTPDASDPIVLRRIKVYEEDASRHGLWVLRQIGVPAAEADQWVSDWFAADWRWLEHYYTTGERLPYRDMFRSGSELIFPLAMGAFTPERFEMRQAFTD